MAAKYKEMYKRMLTENKKLFEDFRKIHDKFAGDHDKFRSEFNLVGDKVIDQIRIYIDHLCRTSESSGYQTSKLSDQFWGLIREEFSEIDEVGIE